MTYQVSRNGQMYGPYALEDLKRYVASGNILPTDLAKSEEMADWLPVSQIIGTAGVPAPGYAAPSLTPQPTSMVYPDPPNLNWGLELLLGVLTCSLFVVVWNLVIASWANRVEPASKALMYYIIASVLIVLNFGGSWGTVISIAHHNQPHQHFLSSLIGVAAWVVRLIARLHPARYTRTPLQCRRAAWPASERRDDLLLRWYLLPVQAQRDQSTKTGPPLPERSSMTSPARGRIANTLRAAAPLAVILSAITILLRFPPAQSNCYPRCPIYEYLHLQCPGCGATRALAALLRGHFLEAMHCNALVTALLPIAAIYGVLCYRHFLRREDIRWQQIPQAMIYCALGIAAAFMVLRNLPLQLF